MKRLHRKVNLVIVISKADSLTTTEIKALKQNILNDVRENAIQVSNFCTFSIAVMTQMQTNRTPLKKERQGLRAQGKTTHKTKLNKRHNTLCTFDHLPQSFFTSTPNASWLLSRSKRQYAGKTPYIARNADGRRCSVAKPTKNSTDPSPIKLLDFDI